MKALAEALAKAQQKMPAVDKTGKANYGSYATLDHLIAKTRPVLNEHGLSISQWLSTDSAGRPVLQTVLYHESGESMSSDAPLFLGDRHTMQALGAAVTYARRYAWAAVCGISSEEDDDAASIEKPSRPAKPDAAKPAPASSGAGSDPSPASGALAAPEAPSELARLEQQLAELADLYAELQPEWKERGKVDQKIAAKQGTAGYFKWLANQVSAFEEHVRLRREQVAAESQFPIPDTAKKKAAA